MEYSISQMARLHGVTRQTLIYYDKIGLLKPSRIDHNGRRFYDSSQMPYLREICFLKNLGIPLSEIRKNLFNRDPESVISLLENQIDEIRQKQERLETIKDTLTSKLRIYKMVRGDKLDPMDNTVIHYPVRRALLISWQKPEMNEEQLHMCYVKAMGRFQEAGLAGFSYFGSVLKRDYLLGRSTLKGSGSLFFLADNAPYMEGEVTLPEGDYICNFLNGMPYNTTPYIDFWDRCVKQGIKSRGDLISICILDSTFHNQETKEDFCQIQLCLSD